MNDVTSNPYHSQLEAIDAQLAENQRLLDDPELSELARQEIVRLETQKTTLEQAALEYRRSLEAAGSDQPSQAGRPSVNCLLELRPGTGGDEAKIWAADLLRMYLRQAEKLELKIEQIDELIVKVNGKVKPDQLGLAADEHQHQGRLDRQLTAFELFSLESGVHRVQRVPETESQGRIHTSTASVATLPEVAQSAVEISDDDLEWQFMRSSGAGGQNVNKVNSAVRLAHRPSGIVVTARQEKKQEQNRKIALELLRSQLWELEEERRQTKIGAARSKIGRARRAEKIRTYNYSQNRVTDHRIERSWHNLSNIMAGDLTEVWRALLLDLFEGD